MINKKFTEMDKNTLKTYAKIAFVALFLYLFLVSIGLMGVAFKGFGKGFAENLLRTTSNPFVSLFIGILATSIMQSSSSTTSITVGMVASGVISINNAIPIIMGANIGTTVTNTLVALGHITRREEFKRAISGAAVHDFFNLICVAILFPLELSTGFLQRIATLLSNLFVNFGGLKFTSPIKLITSPAIHSIRDFFTKSAHLKDFAYILILLISIIILFLSLFSIVKIMKSLIIRRTENALDAIIGKNGFVAILGGLIFTIIVQSSSITTSLLIPLLGAGIITLESAFPVTMGANIGTTTTAILASFATGNPAAITIAFVHFLFNTIGVLFIYPVRIFRKIPISLAIWLGNISFRKRRYAVLYVLGVFFLIPAILILFSKILK